MLLIYISVFGIIKGIFIWEQKDRTEWRITQQQEHLILLTEAGNSMLYRFYFSSSFRGTPYYPWQTPNLAPSELPAVRP